MKLIHHLFIVSLFGVVLSGLVLGSSVPLPQTVLAKTADPVLVGAGDITSCDQSRDEATAQLLDGIAGTVFTLGDNVYRDGTLTQFNHCYRPTWGRHKDRTRPSPGNRGGVRIANAPPSSRARVVGRWRGLSRAERRLGRGGIGGRG